jgi:uncharacterized protein YqgV (UPF0045/DUF77 family)
MIVQVQFSVYPLKEAHLSPYIEKVLEIIKHTGLEIEEGSMSSVVYGESATIFKAFDEVVNALGDRIHFVITAAISNACPVGVKNKAAKS